MLWTWMCFRKLWQQPTRTPSLQHSTEEPPSQEIELQMFSSFYLHMEGTRCSCFFHFPHAFSRWWLHCCPAPLTVPETIEAFSQPEMHPLKWTGSLPSAKRINGDLMGSWDRMNWKDRHVRRDYWWTARMEQYWKEAPGLKVEACCMSSAHSGTMWWFMMQSNLVKTSFQICLFNYHATWAAHTLNKDNTPSKQVHMAHRTNGWRQWSLWAQPFTSTHNLEFSNPDLHSTIQQINSLWLNYSYIFWIYRCPVSRTWAFGYHWFLFLIMRSWTNQAFEFTYVCVTSLI